MDEARIELRGLDRVVSAVVGARVQRVVHGDVLPGLVPRLQPYAWKGIAEVYGFAQGGLSEEEHGEGEKSESDDELVTWNAAHAARYISATQQASRRRPGEHCFAGRKQRPRAMGLALA